MCAECRNKYKKELAQIHTEVKQPISEDTMVKEKNQVRILIYFLE